MMPPLSNEERRQADRARLNGIMADVIAARQKGDDGALESAKEKLLAYWSQFEILNQEARRAHTAACLDDLSTAVAEFAEIADRISQSGAGLKSRLQRARDAAQSGKRGLLIPTLAETSTEALIELQELKNGLDDLIRNAAEADNLGEVINLLPQAVEKLEALCDAVRNIHER